MPRLVSTMLARSTPALSTDPIVADSNSVAMPVGITTVTVIGRPPLWTSPVPGELVLGTSLDNRRPTAIDPDSGVGTSVAMSDRGIAQCIQSLGRSDCPRGALQGQTTTCPAAHQGQWRSGVDCLETFLALIRRELERSTTVVVR